MYWRREQLESPNRYGLQEVVVEPTPKHLACSYSRGTDGTELVLHKICDPFDIEE